MKYSYILPIRNRASLLKRGLQSIENLDYDKDQLEIIIADYMSADNIQEIINEYRGRLNMTYLCIDYRRYEHHKIFFKNGFCNPALAQNLAARYASGKHLILTSPEVVQWKQNLKNLDLIENLESKFIYGRVIERKENEMFDNPYPFDKINVMDSPLKLCDWEAAGKNYTLYFLGVLSRKIFLKYGGIDEKYMTGIAYDDEDFGKRISRVPGLILEYNKDVCGVHLAHDRSYQEPSAIESNRLYLAEKENKGIEKFLIANKDISKFGDSDVLIQKSIYWRC